MKKRSILPLVLLLAQVGCNDSNELSTEISLEDISMQNITTQSLQMPSEILAPEQIYCLEDGFVIKDNVKEGFLKFVPYSLDTIFSYGFVGNGTGEYIMPTVSQIDSRRLLVSSINPNDQIVEFDGGEIVATPLQFKHKEHFMGSNYVAPMGENEFLVYKMSDSQVEVANDSTGTIQGYDFFPFEFSGKVSQFNKANVVFNSLMMSYSQNRGTLFIGYYLFPYFVNVDMATKEIVKNTKILTSDPENRYTVDARGGLDYDDPVVYYFNHAVTADYNWVYYRGYRRSEIGEHKPEIHQFNKDGELIKRYVVDRELIHFGVSSDNKTIYALVSNEDLEIEVVSFSL